jgi:capsular exopolysaccharide synthesis family protein
VRTSLLLSHSSKPPRVILVTSPLPREGKSTTALNLAVSLAQTGARTLLMDLDLRKGSLDLPFGTAGEQGMTTYLSGNSDLSSQIRETRFSNLFLVSAGPFAPNPAELINSPRLSTGLQLLSEYFGYIVIDSPPCVGLSDALLLSPQVEGAIVVARAGRTPRRAVVKAVESLRSVGATVLGVLLNGVNLEQQAYGYYDDYARRYGDYGGRSDRQRRTA